MNVSKEKLQRRLDRNKQHLKNLLEAQEAAGGPTKHTYHGGRSVGYLEGKIAVLEDWLSE